MDIKEKIIIKDKQVITELIQKKDVNNVSDNVITATLTWTSDIDFDLSVLAFCENTGKHAFVHYGNKSYYSSGETTIKLDKDAGVGDVGGNNSETIKLKLTDEFTHYVFSVWDYKMLMQGKTARFTKSDLAITYTLNNKEQLMTKLNSFEGGNVICLSSVYKENEEYLIKNISEIKNIKFRAGSSISENVISLGLENILKNTNIRLVQDILNYKEENKYFYREKLYEFIKSKYDIPIDFLNILTDVITKEYSNEGVILPTEEKTKEKPKSLLGKLFNW